MTFDDNEEIYKPNQIDDTVTEKLDNKIVSVKQYFQLSALTNSSNNVNAFVFIIDYSRILFVLL